MQSVRAVCYMCRVEEDCGQIQVLLIKNAVRLINIYHTHSMQSVGYDGMPSLDIVDCQDKSDEKVAVHSKTSAAETLPLRSLPHRVKTFLKNLFSFFA